MDYFQCCSPCHDIFWTSCLYSCLLAVLILVFPATNRESDCWSLTMDFFETSFAITNSIIFNGRRWIVFNAARRVTTSFARHVCTHAYLLFLSMCFLPKVEEGVRLLIFDNGLLRVEFYARPYRIIFNGSRWFFQSCMPWHVVYCMSTDACLLFLSLLTSALILLQTFYAFFLLKNKNVLRELVIIWT